MWGRIALQYPIAFDSKKCAVYHQDAENRACATFSDNDEHPFIQTGPEYMATHQMDTAGSECIHAYLTKLMLENVRQHVLNGNYSRARTLAAACPTRAFALRRFLWGSRINFLTHLAWKLRYYQFSC
jgi:hypothetical protein